MQGDTLRHPLTESSSPLGALGWNHNVQPQEAGTPATSFGLGLVEIPVDGRVLRGAQGETRVSAEVLPSVVEATHEGTRGYTRGCPRLHMRVPVAAQEGIACRTAWEGGGGRKGEEDGVEGREDLNGLGARS